ncbi:Ig-like domain-containing protein [Dyadobacter sp. CY312]|uniref:Ig-like domain-containing protein n=1 Tax=Dyadobacter sp. CY312 TaxID=2907303 RepID=UPI001F3B3133|nr:T9SS type A sorting domain-containing protein [Dyadobacter sp. CY312]MCE7042401.1 T9SS type A sorting domain-containing protein [Dyadobacter sp. CY312]
MKNLYLSLLLTGLVIAGITTLPVSKVAVEYDVQGSNVQMTSAKNQSKRPIQPVYLPELNKTGTNKILLAPLITATNAYVLTNDQGLTGASAGDELEYTVTISNGGTDATGVIFEDVLDVNTTLVPNSLIAGPLAQNDNYNTIGNVGLDIPGTQGVLANDVSPGGAALVISTLSPIITAQGGIVTLNPVTGAFTYEAPVGYTGNDSFDYTIGNGSGMTATAAVTINIAGKIWFINSASTATGENGSVQRPFKSIGAFQAVNTGTSPAATNDDNIFIYTGTGDYEAGISLRNGQKLIGQGAQATLGTITGYASPSGTNKLPSTAGTAPILKTTTANTNAVTLANGNTIRGLNITATTGRKITGNNFGTLAVKDVALSGDGSALLLSNGVLDAVFTSISSNVTGSAGISISAATGSLAASSGTIAAANAAAVTIAGKSIAEKLTLGLQLTALSSANTTTGIKVENTSGSFVVNGNGSAGSGGVINNISQRGAEFREASGISLKHMNFASANTSGGTPVTNGDNAGSNAAIYANNVTGLTLEGISVSGTTVQQGINLKGVSDFALTESTLTNCGTSGSAEEGCIYAVNTKGASTILNSTLSFPSGRAAYFRNTDTNLSMLTVDNSVFENALNSTGLLFEGWGTSDMSLRVVNNSRFLKNQGAGVAVYANGSSIIKADILQSEFDPTNVTVSPNDVGTGIDIAGSGTSILKFNVKNNTVKAKNGTAINLFFYQDSFGEGTVDGNTITSNGGSGAGIAARAEGLTGNRLAKAVVRINNNNINGVTFDSGIKAESASLNAGRVDATITNNIIGLNPSSSLYNIDVNAIGSANSGSVSYDYYGKVCAAISYNTVPAGSIGAAGIARVRSATPAHAGNPGTQILLQGGGSTFQNVWNGNGNTAGTVTSTGTGVFTYGVTCEVPTNTDLPNARIAAAKVEEAPEVKSENQAVPVLEEQTAKPVENTEGLVANKITTKPAARTSASLAGETVLVDGGGSGFNIPANQSVVIKFKVTINSNIPAGTCTVSNQGKITGDGFSEILTDDVAQAGSTDPTVTNVVSAPVLTSVPANAVRDLEGENCVSGETFTAVAASCPASTVTYSVNGSPITFPYNFPEGVTTVSVLASNGLGTDAASSFTVTVNCKALPVTLVNFSARKELNTTILNWKTTAETNSDRFEIQRSTNGNNWEQLGTVKAKGESVAVIPYSYTDNSPVLIGAANAENLYRLKMIDRDETFAYSRIVSVRFDEQHQMILYPNPVSDELRISTKDWKNVATVEIYNNGGSLMYKSGKQPSEKVSVKDFKTGTYIVRVKQKNGTVSSYKFVIMR